MGIVRFVLELFRSSPIPEGLRPTAWWLFRGSPWYLRLSAAILLAISILLGTIVWLNLSDTNRILVSALDAPWENTQLTHTGIESFLLSSVLEDTATDSDKSLDSIHINSNFISELANLQSTVKDFTFPALSSKDKPAPPSERNQVPVVIYEVKSRGADLGSHIYLSDHQNGYLFVPGLSAMHPDNLYQKKLDAVAQLKKQTAVVQLKEQDTVVQLKEQEEPRLFYDVAMSQSIAPLLCGNLQISNQTAPFTSIFAEDSVPKNLARHFSQAYLIFQSGVARLCESNIATSWQDQQDYYSSQFSAATFLPDRPYFAETLAAQNVSANPTDQDTFGTLFHPTEPYIDLGGNGVVRSFCRPVPVGLGVKFRSAVHGVNGSRDMNLRLYQSDAILCLDFRVEPNIENTLLAKIRRFGGTAAVFVCKSNLCVKDTTESATPDMSLGYRLLSLFYPEASLTTDDVEHISDKFANLSDNSNRSQMTGRVGVDPAPHSGTAVLFSFPLGRSRIFAGKLDLRTYQTMSSFWISAFGVSSACTFLIAVIILVGYGLKIKEQERAFEAVDTVMSDVPAPYVRVDECGKFLKVNDAFARQVGFDSAQTAMAILSRTKYEELLSDEVSKTVYHKIKEERRSGEPYRSYTVCIWAGGGVGKLPTKEFEVHGWDVPTPRASRQKIGQSFGILVPVKASKVVPFGKNHVAESSG